MTVGSAFDARALPLNVKRQWREWSGSFASSSYAAHHDIEVNAIRNAAALIDVSPLYKYRIGGPDAARLVDRVITRDVSKMQVGQVFYTPWCDERGHVIDDGTVSRLAEDRFRWTAADPSLRWLVRNARGLDVSIEDVTGEVAAIALQGPTSAAMLRQVAEADVDGLRYFRVTSGAIAGVPVDISRTGYTGDLGYEIWMAAGGAVRVWDALVAGGRAFGVRPTGLLALDVARVEAGLLLIEVDFFSSRKAVLDSQRYTPFEMGLGRLVSAGKRPFVGQAALDRERTRGPRRRIVGLEIDWPEVEAVYERVGLPPSVAPLTSRVAVPVYSHGTQVGKATSTTWSPLLKKLVALATVAGDDAAEGSPVEFEITVDAVRHRVGATVVPTPFFNPPRKTATPP